MVNMELLAGVGIGVLLWVAAIVVFQFMLPKKKKEPVLPATHEDVQTCYDRMFTRLGREPGRIGIFWAHPDYPEDSSQHWGNYYPATDTFVSSERYTTWGYENAALSQFLTDLRRKYGKPEMPSIIGKHWRLREESLPKPEVESESKPLDGDTVSIAQEALIQATWLNYVINLEFWSLDLAYDKKFMEIIEEPIYHKSQKGHKAFRRNLHNFLSMNHPTFAKRCKASWLSHPIIAKSIQQYATLTMSTKIS